MSCERNTLSKEVLEALMKLPAFRYMKAPVDTVAQLYERYPDGNERGTFAFVLNEGTFYAYKPSTMTAAAQWISVASADLVDVVNEARAAAEEARISAENADAAIEGMEGTYAKKNEVVFTNDVVDDLSSSDSSNVLSANQGRVLNEKKQDAKPDSVTPLINELGRIDDGYMPEYAKGDNSFKGVVIDNAGMIVSSDIAYNGFLIGSLNVSDIPAGHYFIVGAGVLIALSGFTATSGDWIISNQSQGWARIGDSAVTGVKGDAETNYRTGLASISLENIVGTEGARRIMQVGTEFTYIIDSDAALANWANNASGNDYSHVLIKRGTWSASQQINLTAAGTKTVTGENGSRVVFSSGAGFYYDVLPTTDEYAMRNVTASTTVTTSVASAVFLKCRNLYGCTATISIMVAVALPVCGCFVSCLDLHDTVAYFISSNTTATSAGYVSCASIHKGKCYYKVSSANGGSAFMQCSECFNCYAGYMPGETQAQPGRYGFASCRIMAFCSAEDNFGTAFYQCYMHTSGTTDPVADTAAGGYNRVIPLD